MFRPVRTELVKKWFVPRPDIVSIADAVWAEATAGVDKAMVMGIHLVRREKAARKKVQPVHVYAFVDGWFKKHGPGAKVLFVTDEANYTKAMVDR